MNTNGTDQMAWHPGHDERFTVNGLPWFVENGREWRRLPKRLDAQVREPIRDGSTIPCGGRVRFKTDSTTLQLRIQHSRADCSMSHMCAVGVSGIDLYEGPPERMCFWAANTNIEATTPYVSSYFAGLDRELREFTLYLPTYNDLVLLEIGLDADARIEPPSPFRLPKPVLFYGTSITQGGCASRGGNGFVPLVARMLGVDFINLGFSGNAHCDLELAELMTEVDAACYVNDCVANMNVAWMTERYERFNTILRTKQPAIPLLLMGAIRWAGEHFSAERRKNAGALNDLTRTLVRRLQAHDELVHFLDAGELIGWDSDHPSVDGVHLTDLGFRRVAAGLAPVLQRILGLG